MINKIINDEFIAEEIVRTLAGSSALVLGAPIATVLAAYCFTRVEYFRSYKCGKKYEHYH